MEIVVELIIYRANLHPQSNIHHLFVTIFDFPANLLTSLLRERTICLYFKHLIEGKMQIVWREKKDSKRRYRIFFSRVDFAPNSASDAFASRKHSEEFQMPASIDLHMRCI